MKKIFILFFIIVGYYGVVFAGGIPSSAPQVPGSAPSDTAYNATSWDSNTDAATKNAIRDKIETIGSGDVSKVGTPANHQMGVWTGDGTLEGVTVTGSKVVCTDADGEPVACTNLTDVAFSGYQTILTNEAGLYGALSDVTQFYEAGDAMASGVDDTTAGAIDIYGNNDATAGTLKFHNAANEDTTEEYFQMHVNDTNFWMGYVSDTDQFIFSNAGNFTASGNVAAATYGSDASITNAELLFINTLSSNAQDQINGKQASDNDLTDIAALTPTDGNFMVGDGTDWVAESGATARASMGVTIGSQVQAWDTMLDELALLDAAGADRLLGWDHSATNLVWYTPGTGLSITDTTLNVSISSLDIGLTENYLLHGNGSNLAEAIAANALDFDLITTGDISGQANFQTDASGGITLTVNAVNYGTDTGDADIPDGACDAAGDVGNWVVLISSVANTYSLTSNDASNQFIIAANAAALDAGNELDVDGTMVCVMCIAAELWKVTGYMGDIPTDGGAAD